MTWAEFAGARQLLAEESVGRVLREVERLEDDVFARSKRNLERQEG